MKKSLKFYALAIIIIMALCTLTACDVKTESENFEKNEDAENIVLNEDDNQSTLEVLISNKELRTNFSNVCDKVGIVPKKIKNWEKKSDWVSGERYSFSYEGLSLTLYTNMDDSINSLNLGIDIKLFSEGFEPYQISDYIPDKSLTNGLYEKAKQAITPYLNYPSTAKFALNCGVGRDHDIYIIQSSVTAQNAFGVADEIPFKIHFAMNDNNATVVYVEMDGKAYVNDLPVTTARKTVSTTKKQVQENERISITCTYGELGEYGKEIEIDGEKYIDYFVPKGTYQVENQSKFSVVFVASDTYTKNSDGYSENEIISRHQLSEYKQRETITIPENAHIELSIGSKIILTKKE